MSTGREANSLCTMGLSPASLATEFQRLGFLNFFFRGASRIAKMMTCVTLHEGNEVVAIRLVCRFSRQGSSRLLFPCTGNAGSSVGASVGGWAKRKCGARWPPMQQRAVFKLRSTNQIALANWEADGSAKGDIWNGWREIGLVRAINRPLDLGFDARGSLCAAMHAVQG